MEALINSRREVCPAGISLSRKDRNALRLKKRREMGLPRYTLGEEVFSAVSHGVSALFAAAALALLLLCCKKEPVTVISVTVFGVTMILLYTVSTIYHGLGLNRAKVVFRSIDHCTVFLLIAGTYTPVTLVCLRGAAGLILFSVVWAAAVLGVILNAVSVERFKVFSMVCYLAMGWAVIFAMKYVLENLSVVGFQCLLLGGVSYTAGTILYGFGKKVPYMHSIFHLFVLAGSILHTVTVWQIVG